MNRTQQVRKAPKFIVYIDTASDYKGKFIPQAGMIKHYVGGGLSPVFFAELKATELLDAIAEAGKYKQEGVYLVDILQKTKECDEAGYVRYEHILRCRSHGFYDAREDDYLEYWMTDYNPESRWIA